MTTDARILFRGKAVDEMTTEDIERAFECAHKTIKGLREEILALKLASIGVVR